MNLSFNNFPWGLLRKAKVSDEYKCYSNDGFLHNDEFVVVDFALKIKHHDSIKTVSPLAYLKKTMPEIV